MTEQITLTRQQVDEIGEKLDAIRTRVLNDLGDRDREYIYKVIKAQRGFEIAGRALMYLPPLWPVAVGALGVSKILDNMEIGHNVMHGQYDWMRETGLNSRVFDWDNVCPGEQWKHSHNYMHHTFTNIVDMDRDIGYGILRMTPDQKWHPYYLGNVAYATALMVLFEWGVMLHDLEVERLVKGERKWSDVKSLTRGMWLKARKQVLKDYIVFPLLTGPLFPLTFVGNAAANLIRNVWSYSIIFCGHFPSGVQTFTMEETAVESKGDWYVRQMLGSANIDGGKLFHLMSGNLTFQIEHHLFPDIPANRYAEIAPEVRAICTEYGLPYNTGNMRRQLGSTWKKIFKLSLPNQFVSQEPELKVTIERMSAEESARAALAKAGNRSEQTAARDAQDAVAQAGRELEPVLV